MKRPRGGIYNEVTTSLSSSCIGSILHILVSKGRLLAACELLDVLKEKVRDSCRYKPLCKHICP